MKNMNKTKVILMGVGFVVCLVLTIVFRIRMDNQELTYEEVQVLVISTDSETTKVRTQYSTSSTTKYIVKVSYEGKTYDLKNVHSLSGYSEGRTVKAYLSHGKLYANIEGVNTSTPVAYAYFGFLIASFILFFAFACSIPYLFKKKK